MKIWFGIVWTWGSVYPNFTYGRVMGNPGWETIKFGVHLISRQTLNPPLFWMSIQKKSYCVHRDWNHSPSWKICNQLSGQKVSWLLPEVTWCPPRILKMVSHRSHRLYQGVVEHLKPQINPELALRAYLSSPKDTRIAGFAGFATLFHGKEQGFL